MILHIMLAVFIVIKWEKILQVKRHGVRRERVLLAFFVCKDECEKIQKKKLNQCVHFSNAVLHSKKEKPRI